MVDGVGVFVGTRRQLRGVAESLIAGPQHRASGTIRLAVRPGGSSGVALAIAVHGRDQVWRNGGAPLTGPVSVIAEKADVDVGPPEGVYDLRDPLRPNAVLDLDVGATEWIHRSHYAGGHALKYVLPECHPVLWPEHYSAAGRRRLDRGGRARPVLPRSRIWRPGERLHQPQHHIHDMEFDALGAHVACGRGGARLRQHSIGMGRGLSL
jgi:hypothetical protein